MVVIVSGIRPMSTSPLNINSCSHVYTGRVSGILWPRFASANISSIITRGRFSGQTLNTSTTYTITLGIVADLLRNISMNFMTSRIT